MNCPYVIFTSMSIYPLTEKISTKFNLILNEVVNFQPSQECETQKAHSMPKNQGFSSWKHLKIRILIFWKFSFAPETSLIILTKMIFSDLILRDRKSEIHN